jgi:hypothetical protein
MARQLAAERRLLMMMRRETLIVRDVADCDRLPVEALG